MCADRLSPFWNSFPPYRERHRTLCSLQLSSRSRFVGDLVSRPAHIPSVSSRWYPAHYLTVSFLAHLKCSAVCLIESLRAACLMQSSGMYWLRKFKIFHSSFVVPSLFLLPHGIFEWHKIEYFAKLKISFCPESALEMLDHYIACPFFCNIYTAFAFAACSLHHACASHASYAGCALLFIAKHGARSILVRAD